MRVECYPLVFVHGWELWFPVLPFLFDVLSFGRAYGDGQLQGVVPVRAVLQPREAVRARAHLRCRPVGESRADEPVIDCRLRAFGAPAVGGLVVANAREAVVRAECVQPQVVFVRAAHVLTRFEGGQSLRLEVAPDGDLVSVGVCGVDRGLELRPNLLKDGRLTGVRCTALGGDVCVHDDQLRAVREDPYSGALEPSGRQGLDV